MSTKYPGGFITKTPVAPTSTAASGVWTLDQQQQAQKAGTWPAPPVFIEDMFSTWLYTGTGAAQTITNGIDISGKGGLVWIKARNASGASRNNRLWTTNLGGLGVLQSDTTAALFDYGSPQVTFNNNGFGLSNDGGINANTVTYASWTFREQPRFFDVVTYTGDGSGTGRQISHSLGSTPGCIILKSTSTAGTNWIVYHRSLAANFTLKLQSTEAAVSNAWISTVTDTYFTGSGSAMNVSGETYVAYLFAHDAGGFPASGTGSTNGISCGSFTTDGSGIIPTVNLGYEPQWILAKPSSGTGNWFIMDNMRGWYNQQTQQGNALFPNTSGAEAVGYNAMIPTATGFTGPNVNFGAGVTYIYVAIRRGPMKTPTTGTSVFVPISRGVQSAPQTLNIGFPTDLAIGKETLVTGGWIWSDRLRGANYLSSNNTDAEVEYEAFEFDFQNNLISNWQSGAETDYALRRAPGFFDEVCYTGNGSTQTVTHNLGVVPELIIGKRRDATSSTGWIVYASPLANASTSFLVLNLTDAVGTGNTILWNSTAPTSTVFSLGASTNLNTNGSTNVAYLFASCPGVSKVGSFTGTGATQVINCGFTGGARFVLIKATSATGEWYVWDSARGIVAGNDPYLLLNFTAAQVTTTDWVDTAATGFELSNAGGNLANSNGVSYIFLAIA